MPQIDEHLKFGHGAHKLQKIELIDDQLVLYNIDNFMFNSPGIYQKNNTPLSL